MSPVCFKSDIPIGLSELKHLKAFVSTLKVKQLSFLIVTEFDIVFSL